MKRKDRRAKLRAIKASATTGKPVLCEASVVEWIEAAEKDDEDKPKRFQMLAYTGGPMRVNYYGEPVMLDLAGIKANAAIPSLLNHDLTNIVGHIDDVQISATDIKVSGHISGATPSADQVQASAAKGFPWKASVGIVPQKIQFLDERESATVNGKNVKGPVYVVRKGQLREVSFVAIGADSSATVKVAASAAKHHGSNAMNFEQWVEALGFDPAELRDDQRKALEAKYKTEAKVAARAAGPSPKQPDPPAVPEPKFCMDDVVAAHEKHIAQVEGQAGKYSDRVDPGKLATITAKARTDASELTAKALSDEWASARLEAELVKLAADAQVQLIRAERPAGPAIHGSNYDVKPDVIAAALASSTGMAKREDHWRSEVLEASDQYRNIGLQETLLIFARENGYSGRERIHDGNMREVITAAFSTHTLSTILTQLGNKLLLDGFSVVPQTWRAVAQVRSVSDFKTMTAFRLNASLEYEEVGPAGEIKHGTVSQESYSFNAKTYARMMALTRQDIINDDLGAFNDLRQRLGLGAAVKMNKLFWTVWLAASDAGTFWTSARGNRVTSAALAEAGLTAAVKAFRDMPAPDGNLVGLEPIALLVPTDLEFAARKLYVSQEMRDTTSSRNTMVANIYQNRFRPIVVPELGNSAYTGNSATNWWMLADPAIMASAIMCFLNGQQAPTIESADAAFNQLGIQFRGYHDFGAAMSEHRPSVKAEA